MVNYCCVLGCGRNSRTSPLLYFYSVPKDPQRQEQWLKAVGRGDLLEKTFERRCLYRICSRHFSPVNIKNKLLRDNALPTLYLPGYTNQDTTEELTHSYTTCDNCKNIIIGFRYKCLVCDNYDLCLKCEILETHSQHLMLRIAVPMKKTKLQTTIKKWQEYNQEVEGYSSDDEPITKYKSSSKTELSEAVKASIRKIVDHSLANAPRINQPQPIEINRSLIDRKTYIGPKKRVSETDKGNKKQMKEVEVYDLSPPEVAFADVNEIPSVSSEVKNEHTDLFNIDVEAVYI